MKKLVLLTHNPRKILEANESASRYEISFEMPRSKREKLEIQAESVEEVSRFAAIDAYKDIKMPLLVEDSGLFVNALNGFPGVYSAQAFQKIGNKGILDLLREEKDRSAYFECAVTFYDGEKLVPFIGRVDGTITDSEKGDLGFGFDPIFVPDNRDIRTFGEMTLVEKNAISHRGTAFDAFLRWYSSER